DAFQGLGLNKFGAVECARYGGRRDGRLLGDFYQGDGCAAPLVVQERFSSLGQYDENVFILNNNYCMLITLFTQSDRKHWQGLCARNGAAGRIALAASIRKYGPGVGAIFQFRQDASGSGGDCISGDLCALGRSVPVDRAENGQ